MTVGLANDFHTLSVGAIGVIVGGLKVGRSRTREKINLDIPKLYETEYESKDFFMDTAYTWSVQLDIAMISS